MSAQAALVARVVVDTVGTDTLGIGGFKQVHEAVGRRVAGALSDVPADRIATAAWLIDASGCDRPDGDDLLVEAALAGLREVAGDRGWTAERAADLEKQVEAALRALPW